MENTTLHDYDTAKMTREEKLKLAGSILGRGNLGRTKVLSPAESERRRRALAAARLKRWPSTNEKKQGYQIIVGETGNERGHVTHSSHFSDAAAVRKARRLCAAYRGDGWWRVECAGAMVARGGRE